MKHAMHPLKILFLVVGLTLAATLLLLAPIALHSVEVCSAAQPSPIPATREQQQAIVKALADPDKLWQLDLPRDLPRGEKPWLVVPDRTTLPCDNGSSASLEVSCEGFGYWLQSNNPQIPRKLRRDLIAANRQGVPLVQPKSSPLHMIPGDTLRAQPDDPAWWRSFHSRYPQADGLLRFSRATLSKDQQTALILVTNDCSNEMGRGALVVLQHKSGQWQVDAKRTAGWFAPLPATTEVSESARMPDLLVNVVRPPCVYPARKQ